MVLLDEFANFLTQNLEQLTQSYAQALADAGHGYENIPAEARTASARKLLRAVIDSCKAESAGPLQQLFVPSARPVGVSRWPAEITPPAPLVELDTLGQVLTPVVTNLEAGKFLWQTLQEIRRQLPAPDGPVVSPSAMEKSPPTEAISQPRIEEYETVIQVGAAVSTILEPQTLLQTIVDLTKERFHLYHAHIYLLNETGDQLELTAGAGRVGRRMVREGWHIPLDREDSIVARCARTRGCVVVNDVQTTPGYFPNPLLPDTRSEMAVPLVAGRELLGVLDVQAAETNYFTADDERILTALASLAATAIHNARLYNKIQQTLAEMERSHNLLRSVIDATPDWILIRDREQRYRLVNRGYAGAFQRAPEEFIGKTDKEVGLPEEFVFGNLSKGLRGFLHDDAEVLTTGEPMVNPYEAVEIDGQLHIFHSIRTPVTDVDGEVWAVLTFARDVTEREQLLSNTESLYQAGASLNQAQTFDDVLAALRKYTVVGQGAVNVSLNLFNRPWNEDQQPDWIDVMARWNRLPIERFQDRYQLADFPAALDMLHADDITVIPDVNTDPRLDDHSRQLYRDVFGVQSTLIAPLVVGGEWIGFISAIYEEPTEFSDTDLRRLKSLADQAAVAVRGIYQLQTARRLLRREQTIREITERMHAATNLQELLRVTAQELGERLDAGHTVIEMGFQPGD